LEFRRVLFRFKQWGFKGLVVSDYTSVNEMIDHGMGDLQTCAALALKAGLDMDMVGEGFLNTLKQSLKEGKVTHKAIDDACRKVLEVKYRLGLFDDPYLDCDSNRAVNENFTLAHLQKAREMAAQSCVLLKNHDNLLPLKKNGTIALVGPLADAKENMTGTWSVSADFSKAVSVLTGLQNALGNAGKILYAKGSNLTRD